MAISVKCSTAGKIEREFGARSVSAIGSRNQATTAHVAPLPRLTMADLASRRPGLIVAGGLGTAAARQRRAGRAVGARRAGQVRDMRLFPVARGVLLFGRGDVDGVMQPAMP